MPFLQCTIYFLVTHESLDSWIDNNDIRRDLHERETSRFVDVDSCFTVTIDDDFDVWSYGVTYYKFRTIYRGWITHCLERRAQQTQKVDKEVVRV